MGDCDDRKNIKKPIDDGSTVDATAAEKPTGDGLLITTVASTTVGMFYALKAAGVGQHNALLHLSRWHGLCLYRHEKCNFLIS